MRSLPPVVKPCGSSSAMGTWLSNFSRAPCALPRDAYIYQGPFDREALEEGILQVFTGVQRFSPESIPDILAFIGLMENDPAMMDLRWMAYMLATVFIESSHTVRVPGRGRTRKVWRNFTPANETGRGAGHAYYLPVKVQKLPDGRARVTEYDGDQATIETNGQFRWASPAGRVGPRPKHGAPSNLTASESYRSAVGQELRYYGRGFMQLTWWDNYALAGASIGRRLDLLFDPELANDAGVSYRIMSTAMRTGSSFANGRTFAQFFYGEMTDYVSARSMVNGNSGQVEVAEIARRFERVLFRARPNRAVLASGS